jgi:hypothetical protein
VGKRIKRDLKSSWIDAGTMRETEKFVQRRSIQRSVSFVP